MLAMTAHRFWPMVAAVLQTLPLLAHFSRLADVGMHPIAYLTMQVAASWLLPPLLAAATWRHQTRLRRKIGRASCRERVCQYVSISVVAVSLKKKNASNYLLANYLNTHISRLRRKI